MRILNFKCRVKQDRVIYYTGSNLSNDSDINLTTCAIHLREGDVWYLVTVDDGKYILNMMEDSNSKVSLLMGYSEFSKLFTIIDDIFEHGS